MLTTQVHSIVIANTDEAIGLALRMFSLHPELMVHAHKPGSGFDGENVLHILAVNYRHQTLCDVLRLAAAKLDNSLLRVLAESQANGSFFSGIPMLYYGGSPLAFAACFDAREALWLMVSHPRLSCFFDLNSNACRRTGFLPLHAVVVSGTPEGYDHLIDLGADGTLTLGKGAASCLERQGPLLPRATDTPSSAPSSSH